jgi:tRNA A37 threonylcarbamoyladenosine synthetase subunit TsaC/SUA5/YrdC
MTERIELRAQGPKPRLISHIVAVLVRGGLIAYPTDSGYALGWRSDNRKAQERVVRLRELGSNHYFTYCCRTISDVSRYAFVLPATSQVPRTLRQKRPSTIGIRIPKHEIVQSMLDTMEEPILSSSLILPGMEDEIFDVEDLYEAVHQEVDLFVDAGHIPLEPTTVLDLTEDTPRVLRLGQGVVDFL